MLTKRDLHAADRGEADADADHRLVRAEDADREADDPGEDRQLGERGLAPRRLWSLIRTGGAAASRPSVGHPDETLTRHHPISIPRGPRTGRECQWPQPGSPTSARLTRTQG